ncbi:hypothetical protein PFLUV_G00277080 [Perca fluviatilis]|uniref:ZZ-type domain-containing protein n=1 Tax=Perca fluviatilis TaxID=8168 RepID=A0A6A5E7K7_PERFL|nr:hypothetical protein PFLUV_G00277080 [Perca fluviatilis]
MESDSPVDVVYVRHITAAFLPQQEVRLDRQEVSQTLNRMFHSVSQEVEGHVTEEAAEETCVLMFTLYDRGQSGFISAASLQTALISLSTETPLLKYTALLSVAEDGSGSVSRSGLRSLLQDLSLVVQEDSRVFGSVEAALTSCFNKYLLYNLVTSPTATVGHVLSWLRSEPRLLLWLPALHRLSVSQNVRHAVRCHACKIRPITGLRYRCMKCVNIQMCQSCFLTDKHKTHHPIRELLTQPTWRESLSSFVHTARHRLLPRRPRKRAGSETQDRDVSHDASLRDVSHDASLRDVSHDASLRDDSHDATLRPPSCSSIALQTDDVTPPQLQASVLMTEVRNLQRDRWLMEQQLQAFRLTVQSEQGILEDRCSDMEVTMETLREHNIRLQRTLSQALNKMEAQHHADNTPQSTNTVTMATTEDTVTMATTEDTVTMATTQRETFTLTSDSERNTEEEEEFLKTEDEWSEEELQTPSPTMHRDVSPSHDSPCGEEEGAELQAEGVELQEGEDSSCVAEAEDSGTWSLEELLHETVETLKTELQTDRRTERQTGGRKGAELLQAANQVGDSLHWLAVAVTTDTQFGL